MAKLDLRYTLNQASNKVVKPKKRKLPPVPLHGKFRVFLHSGRFLCGVCGKAYGEADIAWICVAACSQRELDKLRIQTELENECTVYVCPLCRRGWLNRPDALLCFDGCREKIAARLPAEALRLAVVSVPGEMPEALRGKELSTRLTPAEQERVRRDNAMRMAAESEGEVVDGIFLPVKVSGITLDDLDFAGMDEAETKKGDLDDLEVQDAGGSGDATAVDRSSYQLDASVDAMLNDSGDADINLEPSAEDMVGEPEPEIEEHMKYKRRPKQKPFQRDGAKYTCTACLKKYFTRAEAERCFERHPLEDIPAPVAAKPEGSK